MSRMPRVSFLMMVAGLAAFVTLGARGQQQPQQPTAPPQQPSQVTFTINGEGGAPPRLAVPEFIALTKDAETVAMAKTISEVIFNDLAFEREFLLIRRDTYATIPAATSFKDVPFDRWRELNADGVIIGTVQKTNTGITLEARLFQVRTKQSAFGRKYDGSGANPRLYAHTIADELHLQQRG